MDEKCLAGESTWLVSQISQSVWHKRGFHLNKHEQLIRFNFSKYGYVLEGVTRKLEKLLFVARDSQF